MVDKNRVDGSRVRLAEVEVGDETGTVSLRARDNQIDTLNEISNRNGAVVLRNCTLELYQGKHIRLAVTKWGKLSPYPDAVASTPAAPSKINRERNFSLIDLSLVASETSDGSAHNTEPYENMQRTPSASPAGSRNYSGQHNRNRAPIHRVHGRPIMGPPQGMHYIDNSVRMNQYGQDSSMSPYGSYVMPPSQPYYTNVTSPDQETALRAHQHQMMQHHHHHQLRMQQYSPRQQPSQRRDNQGRSMQPTSPMMLPGSSYTPEVQSIHMPPPATATPPGAYLMALQQQQQQQQQPRPQQQPQDAHQHPNDSAFMNPQAASFDPATYPPAK